MAHPPASPFRPYGRKGLWTGEGRWGCLWIVAAGSGAAAHTAGMETSAAGPSPAPGAVIRTADAADHGLTRAHLRSARFRPVFHGIHLPATEEDDTWTRAYAVLRSAGPGAAASFHTAARLWGAVVPDDPLTHVTVPHADQRRRLDGTMFHVCRTLTVHDDVRGVPVTSPAKTFIDLARQLSLVDLVVLGDSLVRRGHVTPDALLTACLRSSLKGAVRARRAARYVRVGAESGMESRARMLMVLAGLPEPQMQIRIVDDAGLLLFRIDLGYEEVLLAVEYDGQHHLEPEQAAYDAWRRAYLESLGWVIVVLRAEDVYRRPAEAVDRIVAAMRRRALPVPRRLHPTWQRHFPTR